MSNDAFTPQQIEKILCKPETPQNDPDFVLFWQSLLNASSALASYQDETRLRKFSFADFREAMADAFKAGKEAR